MSTHTMCHHSYKSTKQNNDGDGTTMHIVKEPNSITRRQQIPTEWCSKCTADPYDIRCSELVVNDWGWLFVGRRGWLVKLGCSVVATGRRRRRPNDMRRNQFCIQRRLYLQLYMQTITNAIIIILVIDTNTNYNQKFQQGPMWGHAVLYVVMCPWRHVFVLRTNSYVLALILGFKVLGLVLEKKSSAIIPRTDAHWAELILPQHWADVTACPPRR